MVNSDSLVSSVAVPQAPVTRIDYATKTCGRCGGSGHYSYNLMHGTVCFGCKGTKRALTPAAKKSQAAITNFIKANFSVAVSALVVGDRIKIDGVTRTIAAIERSATADYGSSTNGEPMVYRHSVMLTFTKPVPSAFGKFTQISGPENMTYVRAVTGADWLRVVEFASTLKGVILVREAR